MKKLQTEFKHEREKKKTVIKNVFTLILKYSTAN